MKSFSASKIFGTLLAILFFQISGEAHANGFDRSLATSQLRAPASSELLNSAKVNPRTMVQQNFKMIGIYFDTVTREFAGWCSSLNAGPECTKWPSLRSNGLFHHYAPLLQMLPEVPRKRLVQSIKAKVSIKDFRTQYFKALNDYIVNYNSMNQALDKIVSPLFKKHGLFIPDQTAKIDIRAFLNKYSAAGIEPQDVVDTWNLLNDLKLKQLITVMYYSTPTEKLTLNTSNAAINRVSEDFATKKIISTAHGFFRDQGLFADGAIEKQKIQDLFRSLSKEASSSSGVWTKTQALADIENLPSSKPFAKNGRVINAHGVVRVWESTKGFNSEFIARILVDNRLSTLDQLFDHSDLQRLCSAADLGALIELTFFAPLREQYQQDLYKLTYFKSFTMKDPKMEYQFRDFVRDGKDRFRFYVTEMDRLEKQFPDVIDRKRLNAQVIKKKAQEQARADMKAATENAVQPSGAEQIAENARIFWQWVQNRNDRYVGALVDLKNRQKLGTYSNRKIGMRHENMLRTRGYSAMGTNIDYLKGSRLGLIANELFLTPLFAASGMIGGTMFLLEDGWDLGIRNVYGMSEQEYAKAEKTDAGIKALKVSFYVIQAGVGLLITVGTGGTAAPFLVARTAVAGLTIRTAASVLLKPTIQAGAILARRSVRPLTMAFGIGSVFSVGNEMTQAGSPGGHWDWNRLIAGTSQGASTTLMFMGGMTGIAKSMAYMKASQSSIAYTAASIDVIESSGDIPHTVELWKNAKTPLQFGGAAIMSLGNLLDSGDSAYTILRGNFGNLDSEAAKTAEAYNKISPVAKSANDRGNLRVQAAIKTLKRPLSAAESTVLKGFPPGSGRSQLENKLIKAKMNPKDAKRVSSLYGLWESDYK